MKGGSSQNPTASRPGRSLQTGGINQIKAHASLEEVATMAEKAGVKRLILTHFAAPGELDREATAKAISNIYKGQIIFGYDLLEVTDG